MDHSFLDIAMTPHVRAAQAAMGTERFWQNFNSRRTFDRFNENEAVFIAKRDSFYIATISETGWPYVQHRGGRPGFLKMLDERTLAFPDFRGNLQYISLGNLAGDNRACLILMDYPARARLKIYAHVDAVPLESDLALTEQVVDGSYKARPERIFKLHLAGFDWNCHQHITPRFTQAEIDIAVAPLRDRLRQLEAENSELRAQLRSAEPT